MTPGDHKNETAPRQAYLELEDGTTFPGEIFGKAAATDGEVVFNTGMVGYVESLTDPSYRGQILVLTYPLVGNYGVPGPGPCSGDFESDHIQVRGLIVSNYIGQHSHWQSAMSLGEWFEREGIVGLTGVDTRELTKTLRKKGTMLGRIMVSGAGVNNSPFEVTDPNSTDIVKEVTCSEIVTLPNLKESHGTAPRIVVVDSGCKRSIVRELRKRGCETTIVPCGHDFTGMECDGIMLSNGPGDPAMCTETITNVAKLLRKERPVPIAGICLGCQIMALAAGGNTFKLPYGHRSQNQPCREEGTENCCITSQNHGYAVDPGSLPEGWEIWYRNLNDGTVEGIRHSSLPFFAVQFHPEAAPGPTDSRGFFDRFMEVVRRG